MNRIDLNADLGEGFGAYSYGADEELLKLITSANVACGWHGGDPSVIRRALAFARENGVAVGAHPGYPDLMGFGRRDMKLSRREIIDGMLYQIGALDGLCRAEGLRVVYVKPHGALYNAAERDMSIAEAIVEGIRLYDSGLALLCPSGGLMQQAAEKAGLRSVAEFFADRAYNDDGSLVSRSLPGAVLSDPEAICRRVLQAACSGTVETVNGKTINVRADSVCLHGDNPSAVVLANEIRAALLAGGIEVQSFVRS